MSAVAVPLRGVMVGSGYTAGIQLKAWEAVEGATIVALASRSRDHAERCAERFDIAAVYDDVVSMIESERPDFVDLATPPETHLELVTVAAEHGCHVLCQKPVAGTLTELRQMISTCRRAEVTFVVNENCRFQPWFRRARRLIDHDGRIGVVEQVDIEAHAGLTMPVLNLGQQGFFATMPRLIIYEFGVHLLDTLRYLLGEASEIAATTRHVSPHVAGEDEASIVTRNQGATAMIDLAWTREPTSFEGSRASWVKMTVTGSAGVLELGYDGIVRLDGVADNGDDGPPVDGVADGYRAMQQHFIDRLRDGQEAETSGAETLKTMELVFGAYRSAASGRPYHVGRDISELR